MTIKQAKENFIKWVEVLESGKYLQGKKTLCVEDKYCCLGVLLEEFGSQFNIRKEVDKVNYVDFIFNGSEYDVLPPLEVMKALFGDFLGDSIFISGAGYKRSGDIAVRVNTRKLYQEHNISCTHNDLESTCIAVSQLNDHGLSFKDIAFVLRQNFLPETLPEDQQLELN